MDQCADEKAVERAAHRSRATNSHLPLAARSHSSASSNSHLLLGHSTELISAWLHTMQTCGDTHSAWYNVLASHSKAQADREVNTHLFQSTWAHVNTYAAGLSIVLCGECERRSPHVLRYDCVCVCVWCVVSTLPSTHAQCSRPQAAVDDWA